MVNFRRGADQRWQAPSAAVRGWHKDGSYFRHFLDSREQTLLVVLLWSDVAAAQEMRRAHYSTTI